MVDKFTWSHKRSQ